MKIGYCWVQESYYWWNLGPHAWFHRLICRWFQGKEKKEESGTFSSKSYFQHERLSSHYPHTADEYQTMSMWLEGKSDQTGGRIFSSRVRDTNTLHTKKKERKEGRKSCFLLYMCSLNHQSNYPPTHPFGNAKEEVEDFYRSHPA